MSYHISEDTLFEYMVAFILRNNGYIAGVPRRKLGGRGTQHQIGVIGIDLNNSPFCLNTVLLVASRGPSNYDPVNDMQIVRNLKATILDLEQTLPSRRELIRDLLDNNRGDLFHRIYGGKKLKETLTVNYVGAYLLPENFRSLPGSMPMPMAFMSFISQIPSRTITFPSGKKRFVCS
ncbi:hypothetical protein N752_10070 [Desulforamulus aquiferis]|nr:hypothetical protein [Desulforamulus aquiferis]RYD05310.1 hypothetical protein N752_10070 [Desulforamulus aquiferis]